MKVTVLPHDPAWNDAFAQTKASLEAALATVPIRAIEHVGSTAVADVPAKPVLDIDVVVDAAHLGAAREALVAAGYLDLGEMDIPGRFVFRQPGSRRDDVAWGAPAAGGGMRRNMYVVVDVCAALRNHLDVRRVLREDEELRREYAEVKMALAEREVADIGEYVSGKNEILQKILRKAGWKDEDLAAVLAANS